LSFPIKMHYYFIARVAASMLSHVRSDSSYYLFYLLSVIELTGSFLLQPKIILYSTCSSVIVILNIDDWQLCVWCRLQSEMQSLKLEVYKLKLMLLEHRDCPNMTSDLGTIGEIYVIVCIYIIIFHIDNCC